MAEADIKIVQVDRDGDKIKLWLTNASASVSIAVPLTAVDAIRLNDAITSALADMGSGRKNGCRNYLQGENNEVRAC